MISLFDKCIFVHIPKVAGQSIESVFLNRAGLNWEQKALMLLKENGKAELGPPRLAHLTAKEYLSCNHISQDDFEHFFKFTFVRNPWDRLVSEYKYRKYKFSFKDFVFKYFPSQRSDDYVNSFDLYRHVIPQTEFIYDDDGGLMVDFVGKFENLRNDFEIVGKKVTGRKLTLPNRNRSVGYLSRLVSFFKNEKITKHYSHYYDLESEEFVSDFYKKDIENFGYQFEKE